MDKKYKPLKKVFFRADGSTDIGMGHVIRCLALADMLKDEFECVFATRFVNEYIIEEIEKSCSSYIKLKEDHNEHFDEFLTFIKKEDTVVLKTIAIENPEFINEASAIFGNQCITLAIDAEKKENGLYYLYNRVNKEILLTSFLENIKKYNFGEIILTSVNNDGMMNGFDIELVKMIEKNINVPIVVAGGAGKPSHFKELFSKTSIEAVAASSIFYFTRFTPRDLKLAIQSVGKPVRIVKDTFIPINQ